MPLDAADVINKLARGLARLFFSVLNFSLHFCCIFCLIFKLFCEIKSVFLKTTTQNKNVVLYKKQT